MFLAFALAIAAPQSCEVPAAERTRQLNLGYAAFDSAPAPYGWREVNGRGCTDEAVALLRAYRAANMRRLTAEQALESAFHIGQAYAFADRGAEALQSFRDADATPRPRSGARLSLPMLLSSAATAPRSPGPARVMPRPRTRTRCASASSKAC